METEITPNRIRAALSFACEEFGSQAAFAKEAKVTRGFVSAVVNGKSPPSDKILAALGLERIVIYRPIAAAKRGRKG